MTGDDLAAYCERIGYAGPLQPDVETLLALHAAHVATIPFENLDVQLGRTPSLDPQAIFAKLVTQRRGGWCYEHNGLFGRVLAAIGFPVMRLCCGVVRADRRPQAGSHLALRVEANGPWLVDAGFGSWIAAPIRLEPGTHDFAPWPLRLHQIDGTWQLERGGERPMAYHFADAPADEALLADMCRWQARDPASVFVQTCVAQQLQSGTDWSLRGRVLTRTDARGQDRHLIADADDLVGTLRARFGLDVPDMATIWPTIVARHEALFGSLGADH